MWWINDISVIKGNIHILMNINIIALFFVFCRKASIRSSNASGKSVCNSPPCLQCLTRCFFFFFFSNRISESVHTATSSSTNVCLASADVVAQSLLKWWALACTQPLSIRWHLWDDMEGKNPDLFKLHPNVVNFCNILRSTVDSVFIINFARSHPCFLHRENHRAHMMHPHCLCKQGFCVTFSNWCVLSFCEVQCLTVYTSTSSSLSIIFFSPHDCQCKSRCEGT